MVLRILGFIQTGFYGTSYNPHVKTFLFGIGSSYLTVITLNTLIKTAFSHPLKPMFLASK